MFRIVATAFLAAAISMAGADGVEARERGGGWKGGHGDSRPLGVQRRTRQVGSIACKPVSLQKRDGETAAEAVARLRRSAEHGGRLRSCEIMTR